MASREVADHVKISEDVRPTHYALAMKTDLEKLEFEGRVEIDLDVNVSTSFITFHTASPNELLHASLSTPSLGADILATDKFEINKELEQGTITFGKELQAGETAKLGFAFKGKLDWGGLAGYYKCSWEHEGKKGAYAITMCCPSDARKVFPCWDEPELKATFAVSMISRSGTTSLFNMNDLSTVPSDGTFPTSPLFAGLPCGAGATDSGKWTLTRFATSPKMSTYLLALANGKFEYLEDSFMSMSGKEVKLRVYATPEYISQATLALDVKKRVLPIYEKIFDIPYPLPKLDSLAASDFDAGAMENWGLIIGRTLYMLYDENSGIAARQNTTRIETHEIAHMWFGDIVTMRWWDNLWLNEAFATIMGELVTIQELHPEWRPNSGFIDGHLQRALQLDSLRSSHPIEVPCPDEKVAAQILDGISYSKGASVLRMLSYMLGQEVFLKGVSLYLKAHLYGNTVTADLWKGISEASGINVKELMASWTLKTGFPLVTVTETATGLHMKQSRFLVTNDVKPDEDATIWHIPLNLKTMGSDGEPIVDNRATLATRETSIELPHVAQSLYKLNADTAGVYRVLYTPQHLAKLADAAGRPNSIFSAEDKMGLIGDAFTLAKSGHGSTSAALELVSKLRMDEDYSVWSRIARGLAELTSAWWEQPEEVRAGLRAFRRSMFAPLAEKLGFEFKATDGPELIQWKITAISEAALADDPKTLSDMNRRFALLMENNDGSQIAGDIRRSTYMNMIRTGGATEWGKLHELIVGVQLYRDSDTPAQKLDAMFGMCSAQREPLIKATFDLFMSGEIKTQDYSWMFSGLVQNPTTRRRTWEYLKEHFDVLTADLKGSFVMRGMIAHSVIYLSSTKDVKDAEEFFKDKDTSSYAQPLAQALDEVRSRANWVGRDQIPVEKWLRDNGYMQ
ncbi:hypothetical protein CALCODRAFT_553125 [Calocera cornea HHB12733]|uniref:Aminopeptidase n=1 Tax=Calocera cornea HHB12733 TaxID=1353952 RepID=A0A165J5J1_9BASI|nr:hypothetical protein CALCODRAFT_553125 [Calocera cornea HHB12733]